MNNPIRENTMMMEEIKAQYQFKAISRPSRKQVDFVKEQVRKNFSGHRMNPEQLLDMELVERMRRA
jgi:hypothetical protein